MPGYSVTIARCHAYSLLPEAFAQLAQSETLKDFAGKVCGKPADSQQPANSQPPEMHFLPQLPGGLPELGDVMEGRSSGDQPGEMHPLFLLL